MMTFILVIAMCRYLHRRYVPLLSIITNDHKLHITLCQLITDFFENVAKFHITLEILEELIEMTPNKTSQTLM